MDGKNSLRNGLYLALALLGAFAGYSLLMGDWLFAGVSLALALVLWINLNAIRQNHP